MAEPFPACAARFSAYLRGGAARRFGHESGTVRNADRRDLRALVPDSEEYLRGLTTGTTRKFRRRRLRARKSFENET
jgi:hypothetical protein